MSLTTMYGFQPEPGSNRAPRAWPRFMTARVAADYADSSAWTIRRHVRPCGRRGRSFIYGIEAVEEWMRGSGVAERNASEPIAKKHRAGRVSRGDARDLATINRHEPHVAARDEHVAA